mmetsp:Transcript_144883/g.361344  ORF Transcript_144883/g.361344 Transcript_144883/m.361344 type:complete len:184 (-) Transcript_144883:226-777(-)
MAPMTSQQEVVARKTRSASPAPLKQPPAKEAAAAAAADGQAKVGFPSAEKVVIEPRLGGQQLRMTIAVLGALAGIVLFALAYDFLLYCNFPAFTATAIPDKSKTQGELPAEIRQVTVRAMESLPPSAFDPLRPDWRCLAVDNMWVEVALVAWFFLGAVAWRTDGQHLREQAEEKEASVKAKVA